MKLTLFSFDAPDEALDPFKHELIAYVSCELAVVADPRIEFFALFAHGNFPLTVKQRAMIKCVPLESEIGRGQSADYRSFV